MTKEGLSMKNDFVYFWVSEDLLLNCKQGEKITFSVPLFELERPFLVIPHFRATL